MSLINEALKKAQKVRMSEPVDNGPPIPGGSARVEKRSQPRSTSSLIVLAVSGVVLVVLSVVATVFLVTRKPEAKPTVVAATPAPLSPPNAPAPSPAVSVPLIKVPMDVPRAEAPPPASVVQTPPVQKSPVVAAPPPANEFKAPPAPETKPTIPAPTPAVSAENTTSRVATSTPPPVAPVPTPVVEAPVASPPVASPALPAKADERVHVFVDAIRVKGIRPLENKVLMNDRVFSLNEIVDRSLGLRLTKVAPDSLTFTDANGVEYVRNFY